MDCSGLLITIVRDLGLPHDDWPVPYSPIGISRSLEKAMDCQMIRREDGSAPRVGDWALFWMDRHTKEPQHLGMIVRMEDTGSLGLIHAYQGEEKVVKHHLDKKWLRRVIRFYSYPSSLVERDV